MGCTQSKSAPAASGTKEVTSFATTPAPAPAVEQTVNKATFGGVSVRYAYLSKKGNYPNDRGKPNQDSYTVNPHFAKNESDAFFAVYDGHGDKGHECSQFTRDNLPTLIGKGVANGATTDEKLETALKWAHKTVNKKLNKSRVDDKWSGTTSISVYLHGDQNKITVSNVGDSRAVIGSCEEDTAEPTALVATALSIDHTPFRRDERERIIKKGGRILTEDQLYGKAPVNAHFDDKVLGEECDESGQPPRVFSANGDYPGLSVTRTIGDKVIVDEQVGMDADPEILPRILTPKDKVIVVASDGVWEFNTNQKVIDMCAKADDPLEACEKIVEESYKLWMKNDDRSDDITIICIFLDEVRPGGE